MAKSIIALIFSATAVLSAVNATVAPNGVNIDHLQKDLQDFIKILPVDKMQAIVEKHELYDRDFQKTLAFFASKQYDEVINKVFQSREFKNLYNYLDKEGWFVHENFFALLVDGLGSNVKTTSSGKITPRNVMNVIDELLATLPKQEITKMIKTKVATSPDFKAFYETLTSDKVHQLILAILNSPENQSQWMILKQNGIDVRTLERKVRSVLLWGKF